MIWFKTISVLKRENLEKKDLELFASGDEWWMLLPGITSSKLTEIPVINELSNFGHFKKINT